MPKLNRGEAQTEVTTKIVPAVTNAIHIDVLNNDILEGIVFEKDEIAIETPGGGTVTIDYSNKDTATVSVASNLAVSFTNLENGAVKYLAITKLAGNAITFSGATDVSQRKAYINDIVTVVHYEVREKNGIVTVDSINIDNNILAGTVKQIIEIGDWNMDANAAPVAQPTNPTGDKDKIRTVEVIIRPDASPAVITWNTKLDHFNWVLNTGSIIVNDANIVITRDAAGFYDDVDFNQTSYNRGWVTIEYIPVT